MNAVPFRRSGAAFYHLKSSELRAINVLDVIFKISERCNINCSYCYYFNMGEETAMGRPATASLENAELLARSLANATERLGIAHVRVHFHGGEPMMLQVTAFEKICE